ncbi:hypothetical protein XELAEV_18020214mg [Xenopus laevis]|uniref:G-protein coupled receptors family 1 profile domain-containing protein n=1 Tax=Xenopus laevis TaxID=8355 RepID=A0A974D6I9_XENLA|nr:hypothetical protein XELAEV_18020214mg [Xenopus laevis]
MAGAALYTKYFFLGNLYSLDIVYTSVTSPKQIHIFVISNGRISFRECIPQLYFFIAFGSTEYLLLTVMSYDRYVAVCKPLHYTLVMNRRKCKLGATGAWLGGILVSVALSIVTSNLNYCASNIVKNIFCDISTAIMCDIIPAHSYFIRPHHINSYEDSILDGKIQGILHLCLPTHYCLFYLLVFVFYMGPNSTIILSQSKQFS